MTSLDEEDYKEIKSITRSQIEQLERRFNISFQKARNLTSRQK